MTDVNQLITENLDIWTSATEKKSRAGRGKYGAVSLYGIKKLRDLILELAVRGKLLEQSSAHTSSRELIQELANEKIEYARGRVAKKSKLQVTIEDVDELFLLPTGWNWAILDELGTTNIGLTYSPKNVGENGTPVLRSTNVQNNKIELSDLVRVNMNVPEKSAAYEGDLLICVRNGSRSLVGKCAIIPPIEEPMAFGAFMAIYRSRINPFIEVFMNSPLFKRRLFGVETTTINQITQSKLKSIILPVPPLEEQIRIVEKVDELMGLCDALETQAEDSLKAHQTLVETCLATITNSQTPEDLTQNWARLEAHFDTLFTTEVSVLLLKSTILELGLKGLLERQIQTSEPAVEALKRIQSWREKAIKHKKIRAPRKTLPEIQLSELPSIQPPGWAWPQLGNIIYIKSGDGLTSKNMKDGDIPVYGGNGITGYHDKANINRRTIVIGRVGYYCGSVHITPETAWVTDNAFETYFNQTEIDLNFLALLLTGTNLKENENATAQPVISGSKVYPIVVGLPPMEEQHRIVEKVQQLFNLCDKIIASIPMKTAISRALTDTLTSKIH